MSAPPPAVAADTAAFFRALFLAYPDSLLVVDPTGHIVMCNPSAAALLGYGVDELSGMPVDALVPDAIRPRHAAFREGYSRAPRTRPMGTQMELVARRKDGSQVMVEIALSPLQNHGLPFVVAAIRDIAAYPRVQQALQRARYSEHLASFGRLVVDARDPHTLLDRVPLIAAEALQVEAALVFLLEPDRKALRVTSGIGMLPGEEIGALVSQAWLDASLAHGVSVPVSDRGHVIGALSVRSREARSFGNDEMNFLVALADLLAASLQRVQSEDALNHAQRLESVGQLTGGIAHDFNNLLTVIQGNLQVLEEHPALADDGAAQQLVGAALRATRRGAELTGKLLAFARRQVLQPNPVDVATLLEALADMLRRTLDQHIRIEVHTPAGLAPVLVDPVQLESALLNIAINARDAMPTGGTLCFRAEACEALPPALQRDMDTPGGVGEHFVSIAISDTGTGMPAEVKERALEPFFTTKEPGRGTGLGLSTVYGFVKQSRGALGIDSEPGKGTCITLYMPQSTRDAGAAAGEEAATHALPEGLRVLMVEDDGDVRHIMSRFVRALGCTLSVAASGEEALRMLDDAPGCDLLLTDIALGAGMRGTELAARAQRRVPGLPILLMSGFSAELLEADRDSPPTWHLLPKPCTRQELANAMARVLAGT